MEERCLQKIPLSNGLNLELMDCSRKVAGDRWLVLIIARIYIDVDERYLTNIHLENTTIDQIKAIVGSQVVFEKKLERNFIAEQEKDTVLHQLVESFLKSSKAYLSMDSFPGRYIVKEYKEKSVKKNWYAEETA